MFQRSLKTDLNVQVIGFLVAFLTTVCPMAMAAPVQSSTPISGFFDGTGNFTAPGFAIFDSPCSLAKFQFKVEGETFRVPGAFFLCKDINLGIHSDLIFSIRDGLLYLNQEVVGEFNSAQVQFAAKDINAQILYRFYWSRNSDKTAQVSYSVVTDPAYDPTFSFSGQIGTEPVSP